MTSPARHQGKVAEMSQEWHPAIRQRVSNIVITHVNTQLRGQTEQMFPSSCHFLSNCRSIWDALGKLQRYLPV